MICANCREKAKRRHNYCINNWAGEYPIVKRPEPIKACACQHKLSWSYVATLPKMTEESDGNSKES